MQCVKMRKELSDLMSLYRNGTLDLNSTILGLTSLLENAIIDIGEFAEQKDIITLKENEKIAREYAQRIWSVPDGQNGIRCWKAYVPDDSRAEKRRQVSAKNYEMLVGKIVDARKAALDSRYVFHDFSLDWLFRVKRYVVKPNTFEHIYGYYSRHIEGTSLDGKDVRKITRKDIRDFLQDIISENHVCFETYKHIRSYVNQVLKYACSHDIIPVNPVAGLEIPEEAVLRAKKKTRTSATEVFSDGERKALFAAIQARYRKKFCPLYACLLLNTQLGLRIGEISVLKKSDVDFEMGCLFVQRTSRSYSDMDFVDGKVIKHEIKREASGDGDMKTAASVRKIPLTPFAAQLIREILAHQERVGHSGDFLFPGADGKPISTASFNFALERCCKDAGIPYRSTHKIRKTVISQLCNSRNFDFSLVKEWAGHSSFAVTQNYYLFTTQSDADKVSKYSAVLSPDTD